jgi:hypothetical protein
MVTIAAAHLYRDRATWFGHMIGSMDRPLDAAAAKAALDGVAFDFFLYPLAHSIFLGA